MVGAAATIAVEILSDLDEFNLWVSVVMLIAETTSANPGKENGVVIQLQQMLERRGSLRRKLTSCQHHVLDCFLSLVMDD